MARKNFSQSVKLACRLRATRENGEIYCEGCGNPCKRFEIHHIIGDREGGKSVLSNAKLLCEPCHDAETARQSPIFAKLRRVEAGHAGLKQRPLGARLQSRGFQKFAKARHGVDKSDIQPLPRRHPVTREIIREACKERRVTDALPISED